MLGGTHESPDTFLPPKGPFRFRTWGYALPNAERGGTPLPNAERTPLYLVTERERQRERNGRANSDATARTRRPA